MMSLLSQAEHNTSHDEFQFTAKMTQKKIQREHIFIRIRERSR